MKIEDLKVGMKVKATGGLDVYCITTKRKNWIGTITHIDFDNEDFTAKTDSCTDRYTYKGYVFKGLEPQYFEPVEEKTTTTKPQEKELLRVTEHNQKIKVWYKDKVIAEARCSEEDNYDEEFGLNLALRRFCKTLKNEHEVVITKNESVDDYL